jgi:hypothetical protein
MITALPTSVIDLSSHMGVKITGMLLPNLKSIMNKVKIKSSPALHRGDRNMDRAITHGDFRGHSYSDIRCH